MIIWLTCMMNVIWRGTEGKWLIEDAEKIGRLKVAQYTNQILVVAVKEEGASLCFFEKKSSGEWEMLLETEAMIGENGLGKKREGDGKTPVGVFRFTRAFGILENPGMKWGYTQVSESDYWVDDGGSVYYNQLVDVHSVKKDWESAEHICEYGEVYHYVLAINFNEGNIPGAGSAVFLHCTTEGMEYTAGCVAVPEFFMKKIMTMVEPQCVLIIDEAEHILEY